MVRFLLAIALGTVISACGGERALTEQDLAKCDIPLRMLLLGDTTHQHDLDVSRRPDGSVEYGAIIRTKDLKEVRNLGVQVQSTFDDIVTIRGTVDQLRSVVALPSVHAVTMGKKNVLQ
jgi:hypothetical protein